MMIEGEIVVDTAVAKGVIVVDTAVAEVTAKVDAVGVEIAEEDSEVVEITCVIH